MAGISGFFCCCKKDDAAVDPLPSPSPAPSNLNYALTPQNCSPMFGQTQGGDSVSPIDPFRVTQYIPVPRQVNRVATRSLLQLARSA